MYLFALFSLSAPASEWKATASPSGDSSSAPLVKPNRPLHYLDRAIRNVVSQLFVQLGLFYLHPNIWVGGFFLGMYFDDEAAEWSGRIHTVYQLPQNLSQKVASYKAIDLVAKCLLGVAALMTSEYVARRGAPASTMIAALYGSAQWGAKLHRYAARCESDSSSVPQT